MHRASLLLTFVLGLSMAPVVHAQDGNSSTQRPVEVAQVLDHVMKNDYPEVYQGKPYRLRLKSWAFGDVVGDGSIEVFLLIDPHYQQTAPIQVYRIGKDGKVQRLREAGAELCPEVSVSQLP